MDKYTIVSRAKIRQSWMREYEKCRNVSTVCRRFGVSRKTFYLWYRRWIASGRRISGLYELSRRPHSHPNLTPPHIVDRIVCLRNETNYGPLRLSFHLDRDEKLKVSPFRVYRVLDRAGLLTRRQRKRRRKPRQYFVFEPGHKVQVDTKYLDKIYDEKHPEGIKEYQYTAIDCCTRLRHTKIYQEICPQNSVDFVKATLERFPFVVDCVQTDNGTEFTYELLPQVNVEHPLDKFLKEQGIEHKLIPVGRKEYNGRVERSHRTDDEELYRPSKFTNVQDRRAGAKHYLEYYNNRRPHSALCYKTPLEKLQSFPQYQSVTYV